MNQIQRQQPDENRRVRFAEAGAWARHYSNVRLALTTFLVSISVGILNLKWAERELIFMWSSLAVWIGAIVFFVVFTIDEYKMFGRQDEHRRHLLDTREERKIPKWYFDKATWIFIALSIVFLAAWFAWWSVSPDSPGVPT